MSECEFPCDKCGSVFRKPKHLRYHQETVHSTERRYVCEECGCSYKRTSHLRRHVQNAHSSMQLACPYPDCGKMFNGREQLTKHMRRHATRGSHACELCGKAFGKKRQLEAHVAKIHGPFECGKCQQVFHSRMEFRLLASSAHSASADEEDVHCDYCELVFPSRNLLREHVRTHKSFPCDLCGSVFSRERGLRSHIQQKHVGDTDALRRTCPHCAVEFSSVSNMNTHIRVAHEGSKAFVCQFCSKCFGYKNVLERHMEAFHSGHGSDTTDEDDLTPKRHKRTTVEPEYQLPKLRSMVVSVGPSQSDLEFQL